MPERRRSPVPSLAAPLCAALLCAAPALLAQEYSYDGNRWYEVELIVFRHLQPPGLIGERPAPESTELGYLPNLRALRSPTSSYEVDFDAIRAEARPGAAETADRAAEAPALEPPYSPAAERPYRLADFRRDPYIALDRKHWGMSRDLQRLDESPRHEVLWHGLWRQPMQGPAQSAAVLVSGGEPYGEHRELEGSVRLLDRQGSSELELNLWYARFDSRPGGLLPAAWSLPPVPALAAPESPARDEAGVQPGFFGGRQSWTPEQVWQIRRRQALRAGDYYYLDNPAFGVLLQIRPYVLPANGARGGEEDF